MVGDLSKTLALVASPVVKSVSFKGDLISESIFTLVPSTQQCAKSLFSAFQLQVKKDNNLAHCFEDRTNVKIFSEIKPLLPVFL